MADDEPDSPPPLPKGSYNLNFDELDETSNPFVSRKRLESSPERDKNNSNFNPFETKSKLPSTPTENTANCDEVDPFQTKSKLSASPSGDMDNEINPFQSRSKLGTSPPKDINVENVEDPFKTKSKLGSSPPKDIDTENPFKTKSKLGSSPPRQSESVLNDKVVSSEADSNGVNCATVGGESQSDNDNVIKDRTDATPTPPLTASDAGDDSQGEKVQDGGADLTEKVPKTKPKKVSSPPKKGSGIKKPKARSKFKPPPNFGVQESDEVVIFAPPPPKQDTAQTIQEPDQDNTVTSSAGYQNEAEQETESDDYIGHQGGEKA